MANRTFVIASQIALESKEFILDRFLPDYETYDIMIGYRADDSYFSFSQAFLNNTISLQQLAKAMYLGKLGEQIVLRSQKSFTRISYLDSFIAEGSHYYTQRTLRDETARSEFQKEKILVVR